MMGARRGWREGKAESGEKAESFHGSLPGDTARLYRVHSRTSGFSRTLHAAATSWRIFRA